MPDIFVDPTEEDPKQPSGESPKESWIERHKDSISLLREPAGSPGIFTAFAPKPDGMAFEDQEADEEILLLLRQHFITNVPWIVSTIIFALLPIFLLPFLRLELLTLLPVPLPNNFVLTAVAFYYLVIFGFALNQFATWFYQVGIITNIRIVDVDFNTLLSRNIAYTDLSDIVDTEAHQRGLLQSLFNFGNVGVQTAGVKANFEFTKIPQPNKVVDTLSDLMRSHKRHG